jgi:hypothetical protein
MSMRTILKVALVLTGVGQAVSLSAMHEFHPGQIWPDDHAVHINAHGGGILFHEGVYYWFGEHKTAGNAGNHAHVGVHVYASTDLYNWRDAGVALAVSNDPQSDIVDGCILERPKVIYNKRTAKFVMWFHLELKGQGYRAARSGVAVADRVEGPYQFLGSFRPNNGVEPANAAESEAEPKAADSRGPDGQPYFRRDLAGGQMARDMTLFVDDDDHAYQIYASEENRTLHISLLSDDYLKPAGKWVRALTGEWNEAPAVFKRGAKYYLITSGCTGWKPNAARCAVANSIWGPWTDLGNPCVGKDAELTFRGQSTYVLPVPGKKDAFIFMADRWVPDNAIAGKHLWLPIEFDGDKPVLRWRDQWDLSEFQ